MGRVYTVNWDAPTAVTVQIDVFELTPAANKPIAIHELRMWQTSDVGDAEEEIIAVSLIRGYTTSGSGGATSTPVPKDSPDTAAGLAAEVRNTTLASTGTPATVHKDAWNVRIPYIWTPTPEMRPVVSALSTRLVVRLGAAPTDSITMDASITVEELV